VLGWEIRKMDLDLGDESRECLDDLLGGPKWPLDNLVHAGSLQLCSRIDRLAGGARDGGRVGA
jgi:hypothetical protein